MLTQNSERMACTCRGRFDGNKPEIGSKQQYRLGRKYFHVENIKLRRNRKSSVSFVNRISRLAICRSYPETHRLTCYIVQLTTICVGQYNSGIYPKLCLLTSDKCNGFRLAAVVRLFSCVRSLFHLSSGAL